MAGRRLLKDLKKIEKESEEGQNLGITATPEEDSLFRWNAVIFGPDETEWEGGIFKLSLEFTEEYPNKAPKVKFLTKMFHPNIYNDGQICLDILQGMWSPVYDISSILTSIQSLLCDPNPKSPANNEAAELFNKNYKEYVQRVKEMVEKSLNEDDGDITMK